MFGVTECVICKNGFEKLAPMSICCGKECRKIHNLNKMREWHRVNHDHEVEYRKPKKRRERWSIMRRDGRREVYQIWGNKENDWKIAEYDAINILEKEGYNFVRLLNYIKHSVFDIVATDKMGFINVFQITTRTHTSKKYQHLFAMDLRLIHKALFISTKNKKYVIKELSKRGYAELNMSEVMSARKYV